MDKNEVYVAKTSINEIISVVRQTCAAWLYFCIGLAATLLMMPKPAFCVHFFVLLAFGWLHFGVSLSRGTQKVRLMGPSRREGLAQILDGSTWMNVCTTAEATDKTTSSVFCVELKYSNVVTQELVATNATKMVRLDCAPSRYSIDGCNRSYAPPKGCRMLQIVCEPAVHLISSQTPGSGQVEYYSPGRVWRAVGWAEQHNELVASMVCIELGYPGVLEAKPVNNSKRLSTMILNCDHDSANSTQDCDVSAGVASFLISINCTSDVRWANKTLANQGLVQLYYHNQWRHVCAPGWSLQKSDLICMTLGYAFFSGLLMDYFSRNRRDVVNTWESGGECKAGVVSFRMCLVKPLVQRECATNDDLVGVNCVSNVRFRKISPFVWIVEIQRFSDWFRITAKSWNTTAANIVCRQNGYPSAERTDFFNDGIKVVKYIKELACNGKEETLDSCDLQWGFSPNDERSFASLKCNRDIRLIEDYGSASATVLSNGSSKMVEGTVQLFNKVAMDWGLVADHSWTLADAIVACRHLGYHTASSNFTTEFTGNELISVEQPRCKSTEVSLHECDAKQKWNISHIYESNRVVGGVTCAQLSDAICTTCNCVSTTVDCSKRKLSHLPWINNQYDPNVLKKYILRDNEIKSVKKNHFPFASLEDLDLSQNKISLLPKDVFQYVRKLKKLNISRNKIDKLTQETFAKLDKLRTLDVSENNMNASNMKFLTGLPNLKYLRADNFVACCFAKDVLPRVNCESRESAFSDCKALLREPTVRYVIWVMIVFTLIGNISVFVSRFFVKDGNISQKLFINSLGISDLLMGVYLTIIASKDQMLRGDYYKHERAWRQSTGCMVAHLLSMISSQASLMTLVAITYDRFRTITNIAQQRKIGGRRALAIVVAIWLISGGLAALSLYNPGASIGDDDGGIAVREYSKNAVCLPLVLRGRETPGWELSFLLYGIVNLGLSCYLLIAYIWMFVVIHKTSKRVQSTRIKTESALAKRMLCIVVSDLVCWLPVIICVFLAVFGLLPEDLAKGEIFAFLAVCAIPINSALNPLLYTISTPAMTKMFTKLRKKKAQNRGC